jgi:hypothetical protein
VSSSISLLFKACSSSKPRGVGYYPPRGKGKSRKSSHFQIYDWKNKVYYFNITGGEQFVEVDFETGHFSNHHFRNKSGQEKIKSANWYFDSVDLIPYLD